MEKKFIMEYKNIFSHVSISVLSSISKTKTQTESMQTHALYIRLEIGMSDHQLSHTMNINPAKFDVGYPLHCQTVTQPKGLWTTSKEMLLRGG